VTIESYTVNYDRDGTPINGIAACRLTDGTRTWATTTDAADLTWMTTSDDVIGDTADVRGGRLVTQHS
jgi:hypothetical protein